LSKIEWWYFTGGLLGVFYVAVATFAAPVIGATQLVALVIGGQLIMSILIDHFGLFGFAKLPLDITRLIGLSLMIAGVILIKK
jgi:transporter family-2 protein